MQGKVKWFNKRAGYGFIKGQEEKDIFVHFSKLSQSGFRYLEENETVEFELIETEKGLQAINVVNIFEEELINQK